MRDEPTGPYIYQPYGALSDKEHAAAGRLWGIGGLSPLTTIKGLTKAEAQAILYIITPSETLIGMIDSRPTAQGHVD